MGLSSINKDEFVSSGNLNTGPQIAYNWWPVIDKGGGGEGTVVWQVEKYKKLYHSDQLFQYFNFNPLLERV